MSRIVSFLPACLALMLAAGLMVFSPHNPSVRMAGIALVMLSLVLGGWAQRRAPLPRRGLGQSALAALIAVIFLATVALIVFLPMLRG